MTADEITVKASQIVRVLEMTMQDVTAGDIATRLGTQIGRVQAIQNAHGYPNERTMLDQVRQLLTMRDLPVTFEADTTATPPRDETTPARPPVMTRPAVAPRPAAVPPPAVQNGDALQAFLDNARKHPRAAIANEAERIVARIARLREAVTEVNADQKRLDEIARLEARLAELRGKKAAKSREARGAYPCDQCDKVATSGAGLSAHQRAAHGGAS